MQQFVQKDPRMFFQFHAILPSDLNGFAFVKYRTYLQSGLQGMPTTFVHCFDIVVPTSFEVLLYLKWLVHIDGVLRDIKLHTHRSYNAGTRIAIAVSLVSSSWK